MPETVWSPVVGWEGRYDVSNTGQVRSWWYSKRHLETPRLLKSKIDRYGYPVVCLRHKKIRKYPPIHKLVAEAFLEKSSTALQVNHKDGNKQNNNVENLEWVTNKENMNHAFKTGLISKANLSAGQKRRYESSEERELSRQRTKALWKTEDFKEKQKATRSKGEYISALKERRKLQSPPTAGRKRINNGEKEKLVKKEELSTYLENGWALGCLSRYKKRG